MNTPTPPGGNAGPADEPPGGVDFTALVADHNVERSAEQDAGARTGSRPMASGWRGRLASILRDDRSRWWRIAYPILVAGVVVVLVPALVLVGIRVILDSSDGQLVKRVTDPAAPGYEAVITKTPTALVALSDDDGSLVGITLLALTSDSSGGVLTMPPTLTYQTQFGPLPVSLAWANGSLEALSSAVGSVLNLSFAEQVVVRASEWSTITGPAGSIALTIPDPVRSADGLVVLAKGSTQVRPEQVATLLTGKGAAESELNRTLRQEVFWKAWLDRLRSTGAPYPGSTTSGLGRFVASLSRSQVSVSALPVLPLPDLPPFPQRYQAVPQATMASVAAIVPFPDGAPGGRPFVRVLDGTGRLGNGLDAAIQLNAGGGQVDVVGNAKSFGQETTQIIWFEGSSEEAARQMREALGDIGEIVRSSATNSASDITVILGEDYVEKYGPSSGPVDATGPTQ